jgi:glycyl-tRNA synthetase beta subunit
MNEEFNTFRHRLDRFAENPTIPNLRIMAKTFPIDPDLFKTNWEKDLYNILLEIEPACDLLYDNKHYLACIYVANMLTKPINNFMDNIKIKDLTEPRKSNALSMLTRCELCANMVADLSKLRGM